MTSYSVERVHCALEGATVEHIVVRFDDGEELRWCQRCFEVLDVATWARRSGRGDGDS